MENLRIFINYRREDATLHASWIHDRLAREFGREQVFLDTSIEPGDDFVKVLVEKVESCDVLLAVIGKSWLTITDSGGQPRIHNPEDFVAIEIGAALRRNVRVIPILVGGARMPRVRELPDSLTPLATKQAHELPDRVFMPALEKLFPVLRKSRGAATGGEAAPLAFSEMAILHPGTKRVNRKDGMTYLWIPSGSFTMGCSPGDSACYEDEKPAHRVEITNGFWLAETPVTQHAYERVMGVNPSHFRGPQRPVECVSWEEAIEYCHGAAARLPTEAEWEYAARAGSKAARYGELDQIGWYDKNSKSRTHDSKGKRPNDWGLYDMLGNVWEWVADWFDESYYRRGEVIDPTGPNYGTKRIVRGGAWSFDSRMARVSFRSGLGPSTRYDDFGFRCAADNV
jgi:formylglycine-generating enzyme required for sulfatase activity